MVNLRAEHGVYLAVGGVLVAFLTFLFYMGPFGWIIGVLIFFAIIKLTEWSGVFQETDPQPKISCPGCGARNSTERVTCCYCNRPLTDSK